MILFSSCEDFLEKTHPGTLTYDKFYTTEKDFQASLNACYRSLQSQVLLLLDFNDLMADNVYVNSYNTDDRVNLDQCNIATNSTTIKGFWQACYYSITYSNMVITRINDSQVPEATKEVFTDEAKFIRAYSYFNLVRIFGGVPKYAQEVSDINEIYLVGRSTVDEIYAFISSDLEDVLDIDSERSPEQAARAKGKASSLSAKALLGKVYLQKGDYENAKTTLADIVNNGGLELEANLSSLYNSDDPFNKEILFAINYERVLGQNSPFTYNSLPKFSRGILPNVTANDNGDGAWNIEPHTFAKFSFGDKRRSSLIDSANVMIGSDFVKFYYSKKYLDIKTTASGYSASDFIVLRYADVLLMYADALNQTGATNSAYQFINQVRERAGLAPLPSGYSKDQMNIALADERQKEFLLEGDRWFDLSYRGFDFLQKTLNDFFPNSVRFPGASIDDHEILFPLPSDEVNLKPGVLFQNTGY